MQTELNQSDKRFTAESCVMCGAAGGDFWQTRTAREVVLRWRPRYGDLTRSWIVCDECDEGLQNTRLPKPDQIHLLAQIRRATIYDQKAVLSWLLRKFNLTAGKNS